MQMGRDEELGSGVLNVGKYLPFYTKGAKPRFIEGDPFVTIIPLPMGNEVRRGKGSSVRTRVKTRVKTRVETARGTGETILALLAKTPTISAPELAASVGITLKGIEWNLAKLRREHRIRHVGPRKGGHWEVLPAPDRRKDGA